MALKYSIEYNDVVDITHRLEIYDDSYSGAEIEIEGVVFLDSSQDDDILTPLKGSGIRVELEADSGLTFSDLYSEYEKDFQVIYKRDSVVKFNGWLNPEGWFESYVVDKWRVSFDCIDGLSFLENLSYVDDSTGLNFTDTQSLIKIISNCLIRTGIQQDIRTDIGIVYTGLTETLDILDNVYLDNVRFVREDDDTIMSCKDVLSSILELFGANITSLDGYWYIYKPNQLFASTTLNYFAYDYLGVVTSPASGTKSLAFSLGSNIDSYYPHHCSANQSIRNEKSIGAYRINYKYGLVKALLENIYLVSVAGVITEWTINDSTGFSIPVSERGFTLQSRPTGGLSPVASTKQLTSDTMVLSLDDDIEFRMKFELTYSGTKGEENEKLLFRLVVVGTSTYYFNGSTWSTSASTTFHSLGADDGVYDVSYFTQIPIDGDLHVEIWSPTNDDDDTSEFSLYFSEIQVSPTSDELKQIAGEFHTLERTDNPNAKLESEKVVYNGDNDSAIYIGAIFKADEVTPTVTWKRKGVTEEKELIRIMGEETLRLKANTQRIFSGDVFGFYSYLSVVTINGIAGVFIPTKYTYNTRENIISSEFRQIFANELTDIDYQKTFDYGNVVKPTIKS